MERPHYYSLLLGLLAAVDAALPVFRGVFGISVVNLDTTASSKSLAPFEIVTLVVQSATWFTVLAMIFIETNVYTREFRWYFRFGVIYVIIAEATLFRLIFSVRDYYSKYVLYLYIREVSCQVIFGILQLFHLPNLSPYPGYVPVEHYTPAANDDYEPLPAAEQICPERQANFFSNILFEWMTPLMKKGFEKPITEKDVWKLDSWDQTEALYTNFKCCWDEECTRQKPWLLRALNRSLGPRFWFGGLFKSMQPSDPAWVGYLYTF